MVYTSTQMKRTKTVPIPVRVDAETHSRLKKAAKKLGSTTSGVMRFSIFNQLPQIEAGRIVLNQDTQEVGA